MFGEENKRAIKKEYNQIVVQSIPKGICKSHPKSIFFPITTDLEMSRLFDKKRAFITTEDSEDIEVVVLQVASLGDSLVAEIMKREDYEAIVYEPS